MKCERCGKEIIEDYRKDIKFRRSSPIRFCSRSCANARRHSFESKEKTKASIIAYWKTKPHKVRIKQVKQRRRKEIKICPICKLQFMPNLIDQTYCSPACARKRPQKKLTDYERISKKQYGYLCRFTFGLSLYPNDFDLDLIKKHGWYKAKNRGNNLTGVSRDHLYSVNDGFINKVDPEIMKHPANCQLLPHKENQRKNRISSITYEELLNRIDIWNKTHASMGEIG